MGQSLMAWSLHSRGVYGTNVKIVVAMVTELYNHSICTAY